MKKQPRAVRRRQPDVAVAVLKSFRVIYGSVRQHFREVQQVCGLSGSQLWILHEVLRADGIGVSELAGKLSIHQSTCSQLVDKLVRRGALKKVRGADDQRRVSLSVSSRGQQILARSPGPAEGVLPEAIAELSRADLARLYSGLQKIIAALDFKDEAAAERPMAEL
ncbi:MAG: MarR family winged helix-turn-helix transcriptional regulator [Pseudomonadota bacterium]|nr:MarR family winged helix-turn-helix transcriptional regulator [Pseudomonadota bacterium]